MPNVSNKGSVMVLLGHFWWFCAH